MFSYMWDVIMFGRVVILWEHDIYFSISQQMHIRKNVNDMLFLVQI